MVDRYGRERSMKGGLRWRGNSGAASDMAAFFLRTAPAHMQTGLSLRCTVQCSCCFSRSTFRLDKKMSRGVNTVCKYQGPLRNA